MRYFARLPHLFIALGLMPIASWADGVAGLKWTAPAGWTNQGSRPMRAATYIIAGTGNEKAECAVYFFGAGSGGSVEANIERWKGQYLGADGKPSAALVKKEAVHGLPVTTIESEGTYTGMGGPMSAEHTEIKGYRLLGAIVEGPGGNVFLKFTGPDKLVTANKEKFRQLVASFQKDSGDASRAANSAPSIH
jgi:hypothetical protein